MQENDRARPGSLVLYKGHPALVKTEEKDRLSIEISGTETKRVRPKDIQLLHPGPMRDLKVIEQAPEATEMETVAELLRGNPCSLRELAELMFESFSPTTAWAAWQLVADGLYFAGSPAEIHALSAEAVDAERSKRQAAADARRELSDLVDLIRGGKQVAGGEPLIGEVEDLACGRRPNSRLLMALGRSETDVNAHALLLEIGRWTNARVPILDRARLQLDPPQDADLDLPSEERLDLTSLESYAIDDEGNTDPDDAISLEDGRLWVHVADVAAAVPPGSPTDLQARARGTTLYMPDRRVPMLSEAYTSALALGMADVSPALSFGLELNVEGEIEDLQIVPSFVRVQRITYNEVENRLEEAPFRELLHMAMVRQARRRRFGAAFIELPEVQLVVEDDANLASGCRVRVHPLPPLQSRDLVAEAMIAAGEAIGEYASEQAIPFPFSTQSAAAPDDDLPDGLAGMYGLRRQQAPSRFSVSPGPHVGLGLAAYARVTSPLRRYPDLLAHQQLRAHQGSGDLLSETEIVERCGAADAVSADVRRAEREVRRHWMLTFLDQQNGWRGEAVLVRRRGNRGTILIPELAFESDIQMKDSYAPLNETLKIKLMGIDLPRLEAHFTIE